MLITQGWSTEQPESNEFINEYHFKGKLGNLFSLDWSCVEKVWINNNSKRLLKDKHGKMDALMPRLIMTYHICKNFSFEQMRKENMLGVN